VLRRRIEQEIFKGYLFILYSFMLIMGLFNKIFGKKEQNKSSNKKKNKLYPNKNKKHKTIANQTKEPFIDEELEMIKETGLKPEEIKEVLYVPSKIKPGEIFTKGNKSYKAVALQGFGSILLTPIEIKKRTKRQKEKLEMELRNKILFGHAPISDETKNHPTSNLKKIVEEVSK
jgi:hypothetical protein